jgi:ligand-binding SRPBCC domain-containing protein
VARVFVVSDRIHVNAPLERCFLLSTSLDLVQRTLKMRIVADGSTKTSGLIEGGDRVRWRGWIFGLPQWHETLITKYERPDFFQDSMERGRFKRFQHDHFFAEVGGRTLLNDKVRFSLPYGWLMRPIAHLVVMPYISRRLRQRMELLKRVAESNEWKEYLADKL